jgi:transcriptional regulator GlxA family with amidase domain
MDPRVQGILRILEGRTSAPPSLADLAQLLNLSPSRVWHLFKYYTATTPAVYYRTARVHHAAHLLLLSRSNVKEIAFSLGFRSSSEFVRQFRRVFGAPPGSFRKHVDAS